MKLFDFNRAKEFKKELTKYLQALLSNQEQVTKLECYFGCYDRLFSNKI